MIGTNQNLIHSNLNMVRAPSSGSTNNNGHAPSPGI